MFWLIHAVTNAVTAVLVLHEKRFAALKHHLSLRIYWVSSFVVTTLFTFSGILHVLSDDSNAVLKAEDFASFFSFPLTAFLLIASVIGSTGVVTTEGNNNSDTKAYDVVSEKSDNVSLYAPLRLYPRRSGYG